MLRRWSGAANSLSSGCARSASSWLRVSTSSETMGHQVFEQVDVDPDGLGRDRGSLLPASRVSSAVKPALAAGAGAAAGAAATGADLWTTRSLAAMVAGTSGAGRWRRRRGGGNETRAAVRPRPVQRGGNRLESGVEARRRRGPELLTAGAGAAPVRPPAHHALRRYVQPGDQAAVVTGRLRFRRFRPERTVMVSATPRLKPLGGPLQFTVAELAQHIFRRVSDMLQARQPRKPQVPLIVWTSRKMLLSSSGLFGFCSSRTSSTSRTDIFFRRFGQKFAEQIIHDDISHAVFGLVALPSEPMNARRPTGRRSLRDPFSLPNTD